MIGTTIAMLIAGLLAYMHNRNFVAKENKGFGKVLENKWYVDELYDGIIVKPLQSLAAFFNNILEKKGIDGFVNGVGKAVNYGSRQVRLLQSGHVGSYVLLMVIGILILFIVQLFLK
jgi:NADH-quinone oxidoreductase subunit L